jgi:hypothetical protein
MTKTSIFFIAAILAASDIIMLKAFAGTATAIPYALLAGSALLLMMQAATAHLKK